MGCGFTAACGFGAANAAAGTRHNTAIAGDRSALLTFLVNDTRFEVYFPRLRPRQVTVFTLLVWIGVGVVSEARAAPVGPEIFGEVFRKSKHAMLRVRTNDARRPFATGFFIGAHGEFVFGSIDPPQQNLEVITGEGEARATLIGFDATIGLGVGRIENAGGPSGSTVPLRVASAAPLALEQWVVVLRHNGAGEPEPFAGLVEQSAKKTKLGPKDVRREVPLARVAAPGVPGSPVMSLRGELIAVAIDRGERKTRVVPIDALIPFLRAAVLGP